GMVDLALLGTPSLKPSPRPLPERDVQPDAPPTPGHSQRATPQPPSRMDGRPRADQSLPSDEAKARRQVLQAPTPTPLTVAESDLPVHGPAGHTMGHPPPPGVLSMAMQSYLQTMDVFLETQADVMHSLMARARDSVPPNPQPRQLTGRPRQSMNTATPPWPFVGKIVSLVPSRGVGAARQIPLSEDLILPDPTFGGQVSAVDAPPEPLPVIPMT